MLLVALFLTLALGDDLIRETSNGKVLGRRNVDQQGAELGTEFLGIPYAQPPIGTLRFQPSLPAKNWTGVWDATQIAPECIQICQLFVPIFVGACERNQSEDCLYLNVYTPAKKPSDNDELLPVMFWIHGGAFAGGAGTAPAYNATFLSNAANAVVVSINYRLNTFGFLTTPVVPPNLGLKDQRLALQWVQKNIQSFGGDPQKVMIFGESAGGFSTSFHLVSKDSWGLFYAAIMQSNPIIECQNIADAYVEGEAIVKALGCSPNNLTCIQHLRQDDLRYVSPTFSLATVDYKPDGLMDFPMALFQKGEYARVPTALGTVTNEWLYFLGLDQPFYLHAHDYEVYVNTTFPRNASQVLAMYPPSQTEDNRVVKALLGTHKGWTCPGRRIIARIAKDSPGSAFWFEFTHQPSFPVWLIQPLCKTNVCHAAEVGFLFESYLNVWDPDPVPPEERVLSAQMMQWWGGMSRRTPGQVGNLTWFAYNDSTRAALVLDIPSGMVVHHLSTQCDFWDALS